MNGLLPSPSDRILCSDKIRQGYVRKRTLKPAGCFFGDTW